MSNDHLTFKFKYRAPYSYGKADTLIISFDAPKGNPNLPDDLALQMMRSGKLPLPGEWQHLDKDRLTELGYPKVRWSKKFGVKYVDTTRKGYDS